MAEPKPRRVPRRAELDLPPTAGANTTESAVLVVETAAALVENAAPVVPAPAESEPAIAATEPEIVAAAIEPEIVAVAAAVPAPVVEQPVGAVDEHPWAMLAEAQSALARGIEELAAEMTGMTQSSVAAGADAAIALLGSRTFAEAVEINTGLARRGFDTLIAGSAKMSEICVKAVAAASRPMLVCSSNSSSSRRGF